MTTRSIEPADEDGYELWLRYRPVDDAALLAAYRAQLSAVVLVGDDDCRAVIDDELRRALPRLLDLGRPIPERDAPAAGSLVVGTRADLAERGIVTGDGDLGTDGHAIERVPVGDGEALVVTADSGAALVRGTFHLLRLLQTHTDLAGPGWSVRPRFARRVLAQWDHLDGSVERGYAGRSLWKWAELPGIVDPRYTDHARACASIGLNGICLNNVNSDAQLLTSEYLAKVAALADVFRPYGIRVWLAPLWSSPIQLGELDTADPNDPAVARWWRDKADEIYRLIPDFAGFQVKADSEGQPGPHRYGADHADGANMLARAVAPHGGLVLWRAFVYDATVDADRAKCAYNEFTPLDGRFDPNVIVQAKNGPIDFQPREPFHPLFGAMPQTPVALELQITQEYLGHATHLVFVAGMWSEVLTADTFARGEGSTVAAVVDGSTFGLGDTAIVGVANTGSDRNWCGHHFAQANWYAFGRLATDPDLTPEAIADEWIAMTWSNGPDVRATIAAMMLASWPAAIDYMTPLGLHHLTQEGFHYGPQPDLDNAAREDWNNTYFHRADRVGVGFERSSSGSGATLQYHPPLRERFDGLSTCPEEYLLWFHHVAWSHRLRSGRTLIDELEYRYAAGADVVAEMMSTWRSLDGAIDAARHRHVLDRLEQQLRDAAEWRDVCTRYFRSFVG